MVCMDVGGFYTHTHLANTVCWDNNAYGSQTIRITMKSKSLGF